VSAATPTPNEARVAIRNGPLVGAVLSRVVGMLAARALCPIDRLDDALLVTDAIAAHAPSHTDDGRVIVTVSADVGGIELRVAPLHPAGAAALLAERVADEITSGPSADGSSEELHIRIAFAGGDAP
jgi:hypothetical protein